MKYSPSSFLILETLKERYQIGGVPFYFKDSIQSKIWANEYNLRTLLSSLAGDPNYNSIVKSSGSNEPVISLEPVENSKGITSTDFPNTRN